jgi:hypothetical protein
LIDDAFSQRSFRTYQGKINVSYTGKIDQGFDIAYFNVNIACYTCGSGIAGSYEYVIYIRVVG